mmetsp:Transcript_19857/g.44252  ORF Transcript_19857/g.44252 Transcript_19857/m.44252 type:complete len:277 (-) Transcript_19857:1278-2108(-)
MSVLVTFQRGGRIRPRDLIAATLCTSRWIASTPSASDNKTERYIDKWHAQTVKSESFYEEFTSRRKRKCYFYSVDLQGRLFLEEVLPKNIATSLKDDKFLDFFFQRIKRVGEKEKSILHEAGAENDYPFVSLCGVELNFVRPADSVVVFHDLREDNGDSDKGKQLVFGGTLTQPYHPEKLAMSPKTGRLYHELVSGSKDGDKPLTPLHVVSESSKPEYGLIKSSVAVTIADAIVEGEGFGNDVICYDTGKRYPIRWLPAYAEAGEWGLPFTDECDE